MSRLVRVGNHDPCATLMARLAMSKDTPAGRLREAREARGLSRAHVAHMLGMSQSTIRAHENGQNRIGSEAALMYASELGINVAWLLFGVGDSAPNTSQAKISVAHNHGSEIEVVREIRPGHYLTEAATAGRNLGRIGVSVPGLANAHLRAYGDFTPGLDPDYNHYVIAHPIDPSQIQNRDEVVVRNYSTGWSEWSVWRAEYVESDLRLTDHHLTRQLRIDVSGVKFQYEVEGLIVSRFAARRTMPQFKFAKADTGTDRS